MEHVVSVLDLDAQRALAFRAVAQVVLDPVAGRERTGRDRCRCGDG